MLNRSTPFLHDLVEECPQITNQFLDSRYLAPFCRNVQKSRKITKFGLILTPPCKFYGGQPQNFATSFGYYFSGTIARKVWTTPPDPKGVGKFSSPIFFFGGRAPSKGYISLTSWPTTTCKNLKWVWPVTPEQGEFQYRTFWTLIPPLKFFWGRPQNLKPVLDTRSQGLFPQ